MQTHPIFGTSTIPTTGVEDVNGWAFKRARTCESTLSIEEVVDAGLDGVDIRAVAHLVTGTGAARFNGRWFLPEAYTAVSSGLDPATHPGEFIRLDDAECAALERVREHWRVQTEAGQ
jgi:hypothetical protein